jgi:hypothetical protein
MNGYIERMNYYRDSRTYNPPKPPADFPTTWAICDECRGDGTVVNPSIDAGGISSEEFFEDPEFAEDYMAGKFDVACNYCSGSGKVRVIDRDACDPEKLAEYDDEVEGYYECEAESRAERMMGA